MIHEFETGIYPFRLWVSDDPNRDDLRARFDSFGDSGKTEDFPEEIVLGNPIAAACCIPVIEKERKAIGIVCCIFRKSFMRVSEIAHEASHICDFFSDNLGIHGFTYDDGEARAYIVGWAAQCICDCLRNKDNKNQKP